MPIPDMARRCYRTTDEYGFHNCKKRILNGILFCAVIVLPILNPPPRLIVDVGASFAPTGAGHEPVGRAIAHRAT